MNKLRNITKAVSNQPKKALTSFVRKAVKLETVKKTAIFESRLDKINVWSKKQDNSWDY